MPHTSVSKHILTLKQINCVRIILSRLFEISDLSEAMPNR